ASDARDMGRRRGVSIIRIITFYLAPERMRTMMSTRLILVLAGGSGSALTNESNRFVAGITWIDGSGIPAKVTRTRFAAGRSAHRGAWEGSICCPGGGGGGAGPVGGGGFGVAGGGAPGGGGPPAAARAPRRDRAAP